jgi:amidase
VKAFGEEARSDAAEADRKVAAGQALGPLHGVPFTIKENIDVAGFPTTWGVPAFAGAIPPVDAPVVERMRAAGAIAIGRTNLPDMGLRMHTDSSLHGLTRNPWNPARTGQSRDPPPRTWPLDARQKKPTRRRKPPAHVANTA